MNKRSENVGMVLSPSEKIVSYVGGLFEIDTFSLSYTYGFLVATNHRLWLVSSYPGKAVQIPYPSVKFGLEGALISTV
ncbi:hypothetical protein ACFO25_08315 [Paenactinomyces guangxiensis]|uniref:Uncharacterized protein n=1 Tax=Paenactinomyces guangxiensis TaxID=1490290 RepID=A0A7W1WN51_9BACL|nr:hypothetical protein [Paenactinomyces guangxiensis]MBA4492952.1 hypothetical protein [Paenactinomyces guangxiensis]MBH8590199.1 hypothetical protein [Paenactinomyces guangxiensis]